MFDPSSESADLLILRIRPEPSTNETVFISYSFSLGEQTRQLYEEACIPNGDTEQSSTRASRFIENLQIGNNKYPYAVETKILDPAPFADIVIDPNSFTAIVRMVVAEGAGLVQFELLNSEIYSRI